jgi:hypothetical protein
MHAIVSGVQRVAGPEPESIMRASQTLSMLSVAFEGEKRPSNSLGPLQGRWLCHVTGEPRSGFVMTGMLDVACAGTCLVGSGWENGIPPQDLANPGTPWGRVASLEGSVFGAECGDTIVFWITNRPGTALWVLEGWVEASGNTITGSASYTDAAHASDAPLEARFSLARL